MHHISYVRALAFLAAISVGVGDVRCQEAGFRPDQQKFIIQRSADFAVRLNKTGRDLSISISKHKRHIGDVALPKEVAQVDSIEFVANNHAAVLGAASGSVDVVVVLDLDAGKVIDKFYCYAPALSPNRRFLAFIKFFTPHFVPGVTDLYMLYDFQKSPEMNRPSNIAPEDFRNVGTVMYPKGVVNRPDDNEGQPESQSHFLESGQFFWSPNSERVAFADRFQGRISLIVVAFSDAHMEVREREINRSEACLGKTDECTFMVTSIVFQARDQLKLTLRPRNSVPTKPEIDIQM